MTSTLPPTADPHTAQSASGAPARSSYANATKSKPSGSPAVSASTPPAVVGGPSQHGKTSSVSPVNGKSVSPVIPNFGAPPVVSSGAVVNGSSPGPDSRPVTISAQTATAYLPNGAPSTPASKSDLRFGAMNAASGSPAVVHSAPHNSHNPNLTTANVNSGSGRSPSPIPQPIVSGGRPPSATQGQGNQLSFGNLGGSDSAEQVLRSTPLPTGPANLGHPQHLRRESSHSQQGDGLSRPFIQGGGRGRSYNQQYPGPNMSHSPSTFRPSPVPQARSLANAPSFQPGAIRAMPNSAYGNTRSPALGSVAMHQPHMNGQAMHQYSQHQPYYPVNDPIPSCELDSDSAFNSVLFSPADPEGFLSLLDQDGKVSSNRSRLDSIVLNAKVAIGPDVSQGHDDNFDVQFADALALPSVFDQYLTSLKNQAMYGGPQQDYYMYNAQYMPPNMSGMPYPPPSPRAFNAQTQHPGYMPGPYMQNNAMSRTSSTQGSERPGSTAPPQNPAAANNQAPPVVSSSPAPHTRPERPKTKGIVIRNPDGGEIIDLKAQMSSSTTAPTQSRAPAVVSSGAGVPSVSTPPPRSATETPQSRPEPQPAAPAKSAEEIKRLFTEQFKQNLQKGGKSESGKSESGDDAPAPEVKAVEEPVVEDKPVEEEVTKPSSSATETEVKEQPAAEEEDDDDEAWIREIEEQERLEEERQRKYDEEKKRKADIAAREAAAKLDEELKRAEREAEAREEAKAKGQTGEETAEDKEAREKLFGSLKKPTLGPGANASEESTPPSEAMPPPSTSSSASNIAALKGAIAARPKPSALKIETAKPVEPAQPTAGMQSLRSARFIKIQSENNIYPEGVRSPNPALNDGGKSRGRQYDKDFLMQFQEVFKEKPSVDWDKVLKETVGDSSDSARPSSARNASMSSRQNSRTNAAPMGALGSFSASTRTLPPGTTSAERFAASQGAARGSFPANPMGYVPSGGRGFPMGAPAMIRTASMQSRGASQANSARANSGRNNSSRRVGGPPEAQLAKTMPLTAGQDLKPLEQSRTGWKPTSIGTAPVAVPVGTMAPDVVQRKVKAALNKMTPEKFDKIADDILRIAAQSRDETDGRTLRQVIQLTFEKACDEAHWASMYARFCKRMLETMSHDIKDENVKDKAGNPVLGGALFRKYLLNRCQEEFERGWELNLPEKKEGQTEEAAMLSDEYYKAAAAKRRGLGLIQFIGELYKLGMLTIRIMHECVVKLLNFTGVPEESTVESLVKLLRTVGLTMHQAPNGEDLLNIYFERVQTLMNTKDIPSRMYYMLLDIMDLRKTGWDSKEADKGPKTIGEIHEEAARKAAAAELERQRTQRQGGGRPQAGRGDARSFSGPPAQDYNRTTVGIEDLRRLTRGVRPGASSGQSLGPGSALSNSRNSSRRGGLGPPSDGLSSRTSTPPVEKKESAISANAFSVLADSADADNDVASPPSTSVSPALSRSVPETDKAGATAAKEETAS